MEIKSAVFHHNGLIMTAVPQGDFWVYLIPHVGWGGSVVSLRQNVLQISLN